MTPPSLNSIGDKLLHSSLVNVIGREAPALRDYLDVRMPRFNLSDDQLADLAQYMIDQDRIYGNEEQDLVIKTDLKLDWRALVW